jgi:uncharacterized protein YcbX
MSMQVTCTDQEKAVVGKEPLQTLSSFRTGAILGWTPMPSWKSDVFVGWNLVTDSSGIVSTGDTVTVTQLRSSPIKPVSGGFELSEEDDSEED